MRFVIVTGMSGGGKRTALKMLEDAGYYCVDNLPVSLIEKFVELLSTPNSEITKAALGLDVRADQSFGEAEAVLNRLKATGYNFEILFMDASPEGGRIADGVAREREILKNVKKQADYVIDTSKLLTRELKEELDHIFVQNEEYNSLIVNIVSFGFKHGIPSDADLIFDVRFLPNPFYIEELKHQTGNDKPVQDYVMSFPEAGEFLDKLTDLLDFLIPNYVKEGKYQLVIGIGCTGGKHRSVTLANALYARMKNKGNYGLKISHRDAGIPNSEARN